MNKILFLLKYEARSIRSWFHTHTVSKLIVIAAFLLLALTVSALIFLFSQAFFHSLTAYQVYGELSGRYIVSASIVIIGWFAVASAIVSTFGWFTQSNKEVGYLMVQPLSPHVIPLTLFIKTCVMNILLLIFIFTPLAFGCMSGFYGQVSAEFILRYFFVLILFSILINSVASVAGYLIAILIGRKKTIITVAGLVVFITVMFGLINFIFPKESLMHLYNAAPGEFVNLYQKLPLSSPWSPTVWITDTLLKGMDFKTVYFAVLTIVVLIFSLLVQTRYFTKVFHHLNSMPYPSASRKKNYISHWFFKTPLIYKNYLSLIRVSSEYGYILFLLSIAIFFFGFFFQVLSVNGPRNLWSNEIIIFAFIWLIFFVNAYLLRLIFPLMAREGKSAWYLFTMPLTKSQIIFSQLVLAILTSLPFAIFSIIVWYVLPLTRNNRLFLVVTSMVVISLLTAVNVFFGSISPNFAQADDAEKVSTSGMGIITLMVSFFITAVVSYLLWEVLNKNITPALVLTELVISSLLIAVGFYFLTIDPVKTYQF